MRKLILVLLMVIIVSTPCLAQVEPDGLFSIEETLWANHLGNIMGFYGGEIYRGNPDTGEFIPVSQHFGEDYAAHSYSDKLLFSTFVIELKDSSKIVGVLLPWLYLGNIPIVGEALGVGIVYELGPEGFFYWPYMLFKIDDNWTLTSE